MAFSLPPKKEVLIGGGVVAIAVAIHSYARPKINAATAIPDSNLEVARAANSSDAAAPVVGGGGYGYDPNNLTGLGNVPATPVVTPAPETSPVVYSDQGVGVYDDRYGTKAELNPIGDSTVPSVPQSSPTVIPNNPLPPGYIAGWPFGMMPPNPGMLIGTILGYKNVGGSTNSNGSYTQFRFFSSLGNTADWNYYYAGADKGQWKGPFNFRYRVGSAG